LRTDVELLIILIGRGIRKIGRRQGQRKDRGEKTREQKSRQEKKRDKTQENRAVEGDKKGRRTYVEKHAVLVEGCSETAENLMKRKRG
jgi:hypothetical protein